MTPGRLIRAGCKWSLLALTIATIGLWTLSGWYRFFFYGPAPGAYLDGNIEAGCLNAVVIYPVESGTLRLSVGVMRRPPPPLPPSKQDPAAWGLIDDWESPTVRHRFNWAGRFTPQRTPGWRTPAYADKVIQVPVWPLASLFAIVTALLWVAPIVRRRRAMGLCVHCTYDRRGLAQSAPCPECGAPGTR